MRTVLIIDSDTNLRRELYKTLLSAGWRCIEAENGEAGLAQISQHQPEIVLCDMLVPRINGFQLCRNIRSQRTRIRQPIIIATGNSAYSSDRQNAKEAGADRYLVKPFLPEDLIHIIEGKQDTQLATEIAVKSTPTPTPPSAAPVADERQPYIRFWGVRGSIPSPGPGTIIYGGNTSCVELRADNEIIILDAGTGIRGLGLALAQEFKDQPISVTILISHTHWDHIQGFPFFVPAYNPKNRVRILGYEGARRGLLSTLSAQMESPYFPVSLREMTSNVEVKELHEKEFCIGRVRVRAMYANHPGICVGYRIYTSSGSVAYFPDHEPHQRMKTHKEGKPTDHDIRHASEQDQQLIQFLDQTDLLIMDAQYNDSEYSKRVGWGHGCVDDVVALGMFAQVKRLCLFHHDPDHDDAEVSSMLNWARELVNMHDDSMRVDAACEGVEIPIGQPQPA
jgi:phosphoribosyl 1,2-cyclic phosphodiesterase/DNA-binding NarL/FixJ family response regulator